MGQLTGVARDAAGNIAIDARIYVYLTGTASLATLWSDAGLTVSAANPIPVDSRGGFTVFAADGVFDLTVSRSGESPQTVTGVTAITPSNYPLLAGRAGGTVMYGGTGSADPLTFRSSSHATKGPMTFEQSSGYVFNEDGAAADFRIEGDTVTNLFFLQGSTDRVGIGTSSPTQRLDVRGTGMQFIDTAGGGTNASNLTTGATNKVRYDVNDANGFQIILVKSRAGAGAQANDIMGDFGWNLLSSTAVERQGCLIRGYVGSPTNAAETTGFQFYTMVAGAIGERMRIDHSGVVLIGSPVPFGAGKHFIKNTLATDATINVQNASSTGFSGFELVNHSGTVGFFFGTDNAGSNVRLNAINSFPMVFMTQSVERLKLDSSGNVLINIATPGTSAAGVLAMKTGTAPTTSPAAIVQLWVAAAGTNDAQLYVRNEAGKIERLTGLVARNSSQFDMTSNTTLTNVTGLTHNVEAGKTYRFTATLPTSTNASGGVKAAIAGTATATNLWYEGIAFSGATIAAQSRSTTLGTAVAAVTAVTAALVQIHGTITVNAAGTLTVQFAQNASFGTASSILLNGTFEIQQIG